MSRGARAGAPVASATPWRWPPRRDLRGLAGPQERLSRTVDHMDIDAVGNAGKTHDRIAAPIPAGHARGVEADGLVERPARRLDDPSLDLVADSIRIDRFT